MFRPVRRTLRHIRYHSASRPNNIWTRAADAALVASLLCALPVVWLCDIAIIRHVTALELTGIVWQDAQSNVTTVQLNNAPMGLLSRPSGDPIGSFKLTVTNHHRGWPFSTSVRQLPAVLDLDLRTEPQPRPNVQLDSDSPLRKALEAALHSNEQDAALAAFRRDNAHVQHHTLAWVAGSATWWIMLTFGSSIALAVIRFSSRWIQVKRELRRRRLRDENKCAHCGYDLTGLEFHEKCPECGALVW